MNKITLKDLDQDIYFEQLDNGLRIYLVPFENKNNYYINYYVNYGAENIDFVPIGKKEIESSPLGIAHFIEHQVFEVDDGPSPFEFYGKSGTSCNASTNYESTQYEVEGTENLLDNLDFLINYVNTPCFTDESVEKEKGIIIEEIRMYDDYPEWILMGAMNQATFKVHPMKYDLAGTKTTVSNTKTEDLYKCYNTFYNPSNMALFVGGNFNVDEVLEVIKNNEILKTKKKVSSIKKKDYKEPEQVVKTELTKEAPQLMIPRIGYILKSKVGKLKGIDKFKNDVCLFIILQKAFGAVSQFFEDMMKKKYLLNLSFYNFQLDEYSIINIISETEKPKELIKELDQQFKNVEVTNEDLERYKKVFIASCVRTTDNVSSTINTLTNDLIDYDDIITNKIEIVRNITLDDINSVKSKLNLDNKAVVTILPKSNN